MPALLKDAILMVRKTRTKKGLVGYLRQQALTNPMAFMGLLGKVLPLQLTGQAAAHWKSVGCPGGASARIGIWPPAAPPCKTAYEAPWRPGLFEASPPSANPLIALQ
jgi:hypothetical protein